MSFKAQITSVGTLTVSRACGRSTAAVAGSSARGGRTGEARYRLQPPVSPASQTLRYSALTASVSHFAACVPFLCW